MQHTLPPLPTHGLAAANCVLRCVTLAHVAVAAVSRNITAKGEQGDALNGEGA